MIAWWALGLALAQDPTEKAINAICGNFQPVAGTAGFANGVNAIRTNAQTYSAGSFARNRMRGDTYGAMDYRLVLGIAQVPSICLDSEAKRGGEVYAQPLDLGATNLGFNAPIVDSDGALHPKLRVFYASSVTTSTMGARLFTTSLPLINLYPTVFAPLVGTSSAGGSLTTFAVDWIGGATFRSDVVSIQAGYTGTRGLYADISQERLALFANAALGGELDLFDPTYAMLGLQQLDPLKLGLPEAAGQAGMTSLFYRDIPQSEQNADAGPQAEERSAIQRLRTGHLRQEDIAERVDVRGAVQVGEGAGLRELAIAGHTTNWHGRDDSPWDDDEPAAYVRLGLMNLPDQPLYGVDGGLRATIRAEYKEVADTGWGIEAALLMNDPDLLDLYPFGYNALGLSVELSYTELP